MSLQPVTEHCAGIPSVPAQRCDGSDRKPVVRAGYRGKGNSPADELARPCKTFVLVEGCCEGDAVRLKAKFATVPAAAHLVSP
jgi:hypothetical protein